MRIPAISFDPPVSAPGGTTPLHAAYAAGRTAVSPEGRSPRARRRSREPWPADEVEPQDEPAAAPLAEVEPLPAGYPPLAAQRSVLDRPARDTPPAEPFEPALPVAWPGPLPPDPDSVLEQHLRRVMGAAGRGAD